MRWCRHDNVVCVHEAIISSSHYSESRLPIQIIPSGLKAIFSTMSKLEMAKNTHLQIWKWFDISYKEKNVCLLNSPWQCWPLSFFQTFFKFPNKYIVICHFNFCHNRRNGLRPTSPGRLQPALHWFHTSLGWLALCFQSRDGSLI